MNATITGQEIIDAQKKIIGELHHQITVSQLMIQKLQEQLQKSSDESPTE
jgi:hypothetical protein